MFEHDYGWIHDKRTRCFLQESRCCSNKNIKRGIWAGIRKDCVNEEVKWTRWDFGWNQENALTKMSRRDFRWNKDIVLTKGSN